MDANTWLWILAGFLAALFLGTGVLKLTRSRDEIIAEGLTWAEDYSEPQLRALGWAEVLGAVGLVVPPLVGFGIVTPIAASLPDPADRRCARRARTPPRVPPRRAAHDRPDRHVRGARLLALRPRGVLSVPHGHAG